MSDWMKQSFFFDWTPAAYPTPVPITAQCETINIKWSRGTATGPDPVAPYFIEIYSSHFVFPFQIAVGSALTYDFVVPFAPGTQYQICMFDSVGNTGGCQAVYTVYAPNTATSLEGQCANFTFPATSLQVNSSAGQYAWIPSCTDLTLKPQSGTPPYQVTIAPALHPPHNISNVGSEGTTWKVDLQWATPFFVGMTDSTGLSWSYGPLHAGEGTTECLTSSSGGVGAGPAVGGAVAAFIVGGLLAFVLFYFFGGRWANRRDQNSEGAPLRLYRGGDSSLAPTPYLEQEGDNVQPLMLGGQNHSADGLGYSGNSTGKSSARYGTGSAGYGLGYQVEPFDPNSVNQRPGSTSPTISRAGTADARNSNSQQVYVVHHDGGPPPVSIFTQDGAQVVELPPMYAGDGPMQSPGRNANQQSRPQGAASPEVVLPTPHGRRVSTGGSRGEKGTSGPRPMR